VTEELTQKTYFGEATVKLYRSAVTLQYAESNPKAFKTGFPFQALVGKLVCTSLFALTQAQVKLKSKAENFINQLRSDEKHHPLN
jgi:hypothetical protein